MAIETERARPSGTATIMMATAVVTILKMLLRVSFDKSSTSPLKIIFRAKKMVIVAKIRKAAI